MKNTLAVVAQMVMDMFYQQFAMSTDFLRLEHFKFVVASVYASLLQDEYEKSYRRNLIEQGHGFAEINPDWLIQETLKMDKDASLNAGHAVLIFARPYFAFRYDQSAVAIQVLEPKKNRGLNMVRISVMEKHKHRLIPQGRNAYWYVLGNQIHLLGMEFSGNEFDVWYVPSLSLLDDDQEMPVNLNKDVLKESLNIFFAAKNGTPFIDKSNDGNPNKTLASEINNAFQTP